MSNPPDFSGKPDEFLAWSEAHPNFNPHWCPRHWMPCPVDGLNGILASVLMMGESFALLPKDITTPSAINSWWANVTVPACCQFGDEKVEKLWQLVRRVMSDDLCGKHSTLAKGRHACFYPKGHEGLCEWTKPPASIWDQ